MYYLTFLPQAYGIKFFSLRVVRFDKERKKASKVFKFLELFLRVTFNTLMAFLGFRDMFYNLFKR